MGKVCTVYVTKYALTKGIFCRRGELVPSTLSGGGPVYHNSGSGFDRLFLRLNVDCFESKKEAVAKARDMAKKRINATKKTLAELEKLAETPKWK